MLSPLFLPAPFLFLPPSVLGIKCALIELLKTNNKNGQENRKIQKTVKPRRSWWGVWPSVGLLSVYCVLGRFCSRLELQWGKLLRGVHIGLLWLWGHCQPGGLFDFVHSAARESTWCYFLFSGNPCGLWEPASGSGAWVELVFSGDAELSVKHSWFCPVSITFSTCFS